MMSENQHRLFCIEMDNGSPVTATGNHWRRLPVSNTMSKKSWTFSYKFVKIMVKCNVFTDK